MFRINKDNKIAILAKSGQKMWHTQDLMVLWNVYNKNSLYTTISRYIKKGILHSIQKGLYSLDEPQKIDPFIITQHALRSYSYISTETILAKHGVINQLGQAITIISQKSLKFKIAGHFFISRQMNDKYLFNTAGVFDKNSVKIASLERAVADMLYYNPSFYFDNSSLIDFEKVKKIQKTVGYL